MFAVRPANHQSCPRAKQVTFRSPFGTADDPIPPVGHILRHTIQHVRPWPPNVTPQISSHPRKARQKHMAQKTIVQLIDDLDGTSSESIETITFGLDGVVYEIDLSDDNAEKLRDNLAEFITSARRTGGRAKRGAATSTAAGATNG